MCKMSYNHASATLHVNRHDDVLLGLLARDVRFAEAETETARADESNDGRDDDVPWSKTLVTVQKRRFMPGTWQGKIRERVPSSKPYKARTRIPQKSLITSEWLQKTLECDVATAIDLNTALREDPFLPVDRYQDLYVLLATPAKHERWKFYSPNQRTTLMVFAEKQRRRRQDVYLKTQRNAHHRLAGHDRQCEICNRRGHAFDGCFAPEAELANQATFLNDLRITFSDSETINPQVGQ